MKNSYLQWKFPMAYVWVRTVIGTARWTTILFGSNASHFFVHPRVLADLEITPDAAAGAGTLQMTNDRLIACQGTAEVVFSFFFAEVILIFYLFFFPFSDWLYLESRGSHQFK